MDESIKGDQARSLIAETGKMPILRLPINIFSFGHFGDAPHLKNQMKKPCVKSREPFAKLEKKQEIHDLYLEFAGEI